MFLLYVNDIGAKVSPQTTIKLFADDCLLYRAIDSVTDKIQLLTGPRQHGKLVKHLVHEFKAAKCHLLRITRQRKYLYIPTKYNISRTHLQEVDHHPYLSVELTTDLTWRTHISNITGKAYRILNLLCQHL